MHALLISLLETALQSLKNSGAIPDDRDYVIDLYPHRRIDGQWFSSLAVNIAAQIKASFQAKEIAHSLRDAMPIHPLIAGLEVTANAHLIFTLSHAHMSRCVAEIAISDNFYIQAPHLIIDKSQDGVLYDVFQRTCCILKSLYIQKMAWDRVLGCANIMNLEMPQEKKIVIKLYEAWQNRAVCRDLDSGFNRLLAKCVQNYYNAVALLAMPKALRDARLCLLEVIAVVLYECLPDTLKLTEN